MHRLSIRLLVALLLLAVFSLPAIAGEAKLSWDPPLDTPDLAGYVVAWGETEGGPYPNEISAGNVTDYTVTNLPDCVPLYFVIFSVDQAGFRSLEASAEVDSWARPRINSVTPATVEQGGTYSLQVWGMNYMDGAEFATSNPGIEVLSTTVNACGEMIASVRVAPNADVGTYNIEAINPDTGDGRIYGSGLDLLTVTADTTPPPAPRNLRRFFAR